MLAQCFLRFYWIFSFSVYRKAWVSLEPVKEGKLHKIYKNPIQSIYLSKNSPFSWKIVQHTPAGIKGVSWKAYCPAGRLISQANFWTIWRIERIFFIMGWAISFWKEILKRFYWIRRRSNEKLINSGDIQIRPVFSSKLC